MPLGTSSILISLDSQDERAGYRVTINFTIFVYNRVVIFFLYTVHSEIYVVHSPTNVLLLNLERFKIYIKIHKNIAPTCFDHSTIIRDLVLNLTRVILKHSVNLRRYMLFGDVAA
jgi:hypothetical protein